MRRILSLAILPFVLLQLSSCPILAEDAAGAAAQYRIAMLLPLTGSGASLGTGLRDAALLAYESLPPDEKKHIALDFQDDQFEVTKSVAAFRYLMSQNPVKAVVVMGSGMGHAIAPLAQEAGVISVAVGASDHRLLQDRSLAFIHWVVPEKEAQLMADEIQRREYQRIAMVSHEQQGVTAYNDALKAALNERGLGKTIVYDERVALGTLDFHTVVAKINVKRPDTVYAALFSGGLAAFAKQLRLQGYKKELFGVETFEDDKEVKAANGTLEGSWYVNASGYRPWFESAYQQRFGRHPGWACGNAYDTVKLLAEGAVRFKDDNEKIAAYLATLKDYEGAAGKYSATGDHRFDLPAAVKRVERGQFRTLRAPE